MVIHDNNDNEKSVSRHVRNVYAARGITASPWPPVGSRQGLQVAARLVAISSANGEASPPLHSPCDSA